MQIVQAHSSDGMQNYYLTVSIIGVEIPQLVCIISQQEGSMWSITTALLIL